MGSGGAKPPRDTLVWVSHSPPGIPGIPEFFIWLLLSQLRTNLLESSSQRRVLAGANVEATESRRAFLGHRFKYTTVKTLAQDDVLKQVSSLGIRRSLQKSCAQFHPLPQRFHSCREEPLSISNSCALNPSLWVFPTHEPAHLPSSVRHLTAGSHSLQKLPRGGKWAGELVSCPCSTYCYVTSEQMTPSLWVLVSFFVKGVG